MDRARPRVWAPVVALALGGALFLAACEAPAEPSAGPSPAPSAPRTGGGYTFELGGLEASLVLRGTRGELQIHNGTGGSLGPPGIVWLGALAGREREALVPDAEPIPQGDTVRLEVDLGEEFNPQTAGLIILTLDGVRWGAFNPP